MKTFNLFNFNRKSSAMVQADGCTTARQKIGVTPRTTSTIGRFASVLCLILTMLFTLGVGEMKAASTVNGGYIYFDELNSGYTGAGDMQFWIGHSSYSSAYSMSKITNTKLWYISATGWTDATYFAFTSGCNGWGAASQDYYSRIGSNTWKSAKKESYTLNSGNYYVFKAASTANKAAVGSDSPYGTQRNWILFAKQYSNL